MKWKVFKEQMANFGIGGDEKMASVRLMKFWNTICLIVILALVSTAKADIATLEDLELPAESYWNGSDASGGFTSAGVHFGNNYNTDWGSWDGFSYSNITDTTAMALEAQ